MDRHFKTELNSCAAFLLFSAAVFSSCGNHDDAWVDRALDTAAYQLDMTAVELDGTGMMPRTAVSGYDVDFLAAQLEKDKSSFVDSLVVNPPAEDLGRLKPCGIIDWTSGFFPGSLWYAYELTGKENLKEEAVKYTNLLYPIRKFEGSHERP